MTLYYAGLSSSAGEIDGEVKRWLKTAYDLDQ